RKRQTSHAVHVDDRVVRPTVAHGRRARHFCASDLDTAVGQNLSRGPHEYVVTSGNGETAEFVDVEGAPATLDVIERQDDLVPLLHHGLVLWAVKRNFESIGFCQGPTRQPQAYVHFVLWVNVFPLADIDDHGFTRIGEL